jgi:hypothetical protein
MMQDGQDALDDGKTACSSPIFASPRLWFPNQEGQTLLPPSSQIPMRPALVRTSFHIQFASELSYDKTSFFEA